MVYSGKWQDPCGTKGGGVKTIDLLLSQSGFVRTKYARRASRLNVIEPTTIGGSSHLIAERQPLWVAAEGRHYPNIVGSGLCAVIDFGPVGGEALHNFIATIVGKLKRLRPRNKHDEYPCHFPHRR